jgi:acyl carrier protein
MKKSELLREIEEAIEVPSGSLTGEELLTDIPTWDSLAIIVFIALVDEKLGLMVEGEALANARTMNDVIALAGPGLEDFA